MKKIRIPSELIYVFAIVLISLAVAMVSAANFGVSMIVAPAYILSLKVSFLTFGQSEYVIQGIAFIVFCILMKKVKLAYFGSFVTCLIYGAMLDLWRSIIPFLNPEVTAPGSMDMPVRIVLFVFGMTLTSFAVALCFETYIPPQVYDFCVKGLTEHYKLNRAKFKSCFDFSMLMIAVIMVVVFFVEFKGNTFTGVIKDLFDGNNGIGIGTLIMTCFNGIIIGVFSKLFSRTIEPYALSKKAEQFFAIE